MRGPGLLLDLGAVSVRVRGDSPEFAAQLQATYPEFPMAPGGEWADLHIRIERARGLRRWLSRQVSFVVDGVRPFEPFPADSPLPLFEWGTNWLIGRRMNNLLLLHAGALERDGRTLVLPALPGSGKSTLSAALAGRGWRLLSDEFAAFEPGSGVFRAILKPVALKNQSIQVIRNFDGNARLGPEFPKTRKGTVAHLAASRSTVDRRREPAEPGAVILPRWERGAMARIEPLPVDRVFSSLAFNSFNYGVLGEEGFHAAVKLARCSGGWTLVYERLDDAIELLEGAWREAPRGGAPRQGS